MNVSAIIVTRGNVGLGPVLDSLPNEWEYVVWDNGRGICERHGIQWKERKWPTDDLSVYGRYAAIQYASHDLIYVQDDDVIVSDPQAIVDAWVGEGDHWDAEDGWENDDSRRFLLAANMPPEFRHDGYTDSCLVGFGAAFHRDLPQRLENRFWLHAGSIYPQDDPEVSWFNRTCDVVMTTLAPARVLVDVPITHREFASDPDRMWKQPGHVAERARMLELARAVRDA